MEICDRNDIPFEVSYKSFSDRFEAMNWMIDNQLGRRNLNPKQMSFLRGQRYDSEKKKVGAPLGNDNNKGKSQCGQNVQIDSHGAKGKKQQSKNTTAKRIAEKCGVSERTIRRDAEFARDVERVVNAISPEDDAAIEAAIRRQILANCNGGKPTLSKKDVAEIAEMADKDPNAATEAFDKVVSGEAKNVTEATAPADQSTEEKMDIITNAFTKALGVMMDALGKAEALKWEGFNKVAATKELNLLVVRINKE